MKSLMLKRWAFNLALSLMVVMSSINLFSKVTPIPEYVDALDNLKIAFNLAKYNRFSASNINGELTTQEEDTLSFFSPNIEKPVSIDNALPTALREPFPIWLTSLLLKKFELINKYPNVKSLNVGKPLLLIKSQNFIYLLFLFSGLVVLLGHFVEQPLMRFLTSLVLLVLVQLHLPEGMYYFFLTELLASALMIWYCYFLINAISKQRLLYWILGGLVYGLLVLTKAAFIYIGIVFVASMLIYFIYLRQHQHFKGLSCFILTASIIVMPWVVRNYQQLHFFGVTERAADVLLVRAEKNLMTPLERKGALCFYTSNRSIARACAKFFGFNRDDLSESGRLKRIYRGHKQDLAARSEIKPDKTISYYYHATTVAYQARYEAYLKNQSVIEANNATSKLAIQKIIANPVDHLISTFLFAYRGLNYMYTDAYTYLGFLAIGIMGVIGVKTKQTNFLIVFLFPSLTFLFYAFLSHFIPRYSQPLIPFWMFGFVIICYQIIMLMPKYFSLTDFRQLRRN